MSSVVTRFLFEVSRLGYTLAMNKTSRDALVKSPDPTTHEGDKALLEAHPGFTLEALTFGRAYLRDVDPESTYEASQFLRIDAQRMTLAKNANVADAADELNRQKDEAFRPDMFFSEQLFVPAAGDPSYDCLLAGTPEIPKNFGFLGHQKWKIKQSLASEKSEGAYFGPVKIRTGLFPWSKKIAEIQIERVTRNGNESTLTLWNVAPINGYKPGEISEVIHDYGLTVQRVRPAFLEPQIQRST